MPGMWSATGPDQVVVVLSFVVALGFWVVCKLHDRVVARRAAKR